MSGLARALQRGVRRQIGSKDTLYSNGLSHLWYAKDHLQNYLVVGTKLQCRRGPDYDFSVAGPMYDDAGNSVGAIPVVHHDSAGNIRGVWGGPAYTNKIPNPKGIGAVVGNPGTFPTGWFNAQGNGINISVTEVFEGYLSFRFYGTATQNTTASVRLTGSTGIPAAPGQSWGFSLDYVISGPSIPADYSITIYSRDSAGTLLGAVAHSVGNSFALLPLAQALTAYVQPVFGVSLLSGQSCDFTVRISKPSLVQSTFKFPFAAPVGSTIEATSVVSAAGTTGGNGASLTLDQRLTEVFRGKVDGVEKVVNGNFDGTFVGGVAPSWASPRGTPTEVTGIYGSAQGVSNPAANTGVVTGQLINLTVGQRYLLKFYGKKLSGSGGFLSDTGPGLHFSLIGVTSSDWTEKTVEFTCTNAGIGIAAYADTNAVAGTNGIAIDNISIQRLLPATCTVAALTCMGVGSGELPSGTAIGILSCRGVSSDVIYANDVSGDGRIVRSSDGTTDLPLNVEWNRDELHLRIVQTKADGSQFRVGYRRYNLDKTPIDASITWSSWVAFDGSFSPLTALRWFLNGTVPIWQRAVAIWDRGAIADSEILKRMEAA